MLDELIHLWKRVRVRAHHAKEDVMAKVKPSDDNDERAPTPDDGDAGADTDTDEEMELAGDNGGREANGRGALPRARFKDLQVKLRRVTGTRCVIGVDIELDLEDVQRRTRAGREVEADELDAADAAGSEDDGAFALASNDEHDQLDELERDDAGDERDGIELASGDADEVDLDEEVDEDEREDAGAARFANDDAYAMSADDEDEAELDAEEPADAEPARPMSAMSAMSATSATSTMAARPTASAAGARVRLADVQPGQHNRSVLIVQRALSRAVKLDYSSGAGQFGPRTTAAYGRWQRKCGVAASGKPDAVTLRKLGQRYGFEVDTSAPTPTRLRFDHKRFLQAYVHVFGQLEPHARTGLDTLLTAAERDPKLTDVRWLAYMLATVMHECGRQWRPIREATRGRGKPYGKPVVVVDPQGHRHVNAYYGRGYVQLTLKPNYQKMGRLLKNRLLYEPDLALRPVIAYRIMSIGMIRGLFTQHKLADYIHGNKTDYVNARRIIHGIERAQLIARYASRFERMLRHSQIRRPAPRGLPNGVPSPRPPGGGHATAMA
jgi:hypothetical protein